MTDKLKFNGGEKVVWRHPTTQQLEDRVLQLERRLAEARQIVELQHKLICRLKDVHVGGGIDGKGEICS